MSEATPPTRPLAATVLRGAIMMIGLRYLLRGLGLISILITARLLTPADFGVVGTAAIVTGLFAVLQSIGLGDALIRLRQLDLAHMHTAWTIGLITATTVSCGIWIAAPYAAAWLGEPALTAVLRWQAFTPTILALASPGTQTILRDLAFGKEFALKVFQKVVVVVCVVTGAFLTRSYWGLVWGTMTGAVLYTAMSYVLFPFRPRLSLSHHRDFLGFSAWTMAHGLATWLAITIDEIIVRRMVATQVFGLYHVSRDISRTLVSETVAPAAAALLPGLARLQDEPRRLAWAAQQAIGVGAIVAIPAGLGVSATAAEITGLLLGPQWTGAAAFLGYTAIGVAAQTLAGLHRSILVTLNRQHWSAGLWALRAASLALCCGVAGMLGGPLAVAMAYAGVSVLHTLLDYTLIFRFLGRPGAPLAIFWRPVLAALAMLGAVALVPDGLPLAVSAVAKVALGAAAYGLTLLGLWVARGRPEGAETALLHRLPPRLGKLLLRRRATPPPQAEAS